MKPLSMFFLFLSYVIESLMRIRQDMEGSQKYEYEYKSSSLDTVIGGYPFRFWGRFFGMVTKLTYTTLRIFAALNSIKAL